MSRSAAPAWSTPSAPRVNSSSIWSSTTTTRAPPPVASSIRARSSATDVDPGVATTTRHDSLPGSTPSAKAGTTPASNTEDLPDPDAPTRHSTGRVTRRATTSATSRSRPKNHCASSDPKACRPRKGHTVVGLGSVRVASWTRCRSMTRWIPTTSSATASWLVERRASACCA